MHTIEIPEKSITVNIPETWDECTETQVIHVLKLAFQVMSGELSLSDFRILIFLYFTGLKLGIGYLAKQKLGFNELINQRVFQLSQQLCNWVFISNGERHELNYDTVVNYFPILNNKFHGPADLLADITMAEFKTAMVAMNQYFESQGDDTLAQQNLDLFIAILYRPVGDNGLRIPFHKHTMDAGDFASIAPWVKQTILLWFAYCLKCLQEEELTINGLDVDLSVLFPKSPGGTNYSSHTVSLGWTGIQLDIAESGVFGDSINTGKTMLYDILIFLFKKAQDNKKSTKK